MMKDAIAAPFAVRAALAACLLAAAARAQEGWDADQGAPDAGKTVQAARAGRAPKVGKGLGIPDWVKAPEQPLEWTRIPGGKFRMRSDESGKSLMNPGPAREISIRDFELSKTHVTVEQYAECVYNGGRCTEPGSGGPYCNWGREGRARHPVNCVTWEQAESYARFKRARLPSEAEWEYAARSGGKDRQYPWGEEPATCERAVLAENGAFGCGAGGTMPVCSKPKGNTEQGLCDMMGNLWQWVQDTSWWRDGAPTDGRALEIRGARNRVLRGGGFLFGGGPEHAVRHSGGQGDPSPFNGFRIARDAVK